MSLDPVLLLSVVNVFSRCGDVADLMESIYTRQGEISDLVDRIMEEKAAKEAQASRPRVTFQQTQPADVITPNDDVISPVQAASAHREPSAPVRAPVKRSRSTLQRMLHAVRKRLRRSSSGATRNTN